MIQLSTLMWTGGIFFAIMGFLRGWNKELIVTAGSLLALFTIFQFDSLLRGILFFVLSRDQVFLVQASIFLAVVFFVYRMPRLGDEQPNENRLQSGLLGGMVGFLNGYLIFGSLWYFLDINEYPLAQYVSAPGPASASAAQLNLMPVVLLSGGINGNGDFLAVAVIAMLFFVLLVI